MMKIKKSAISLIVLAFTSLILITGSPFQISSNLVENNGHLNYKNIGQEAYAADDDGGEGDDGSDGGDDGSSNDEGGADDGDDNGDSSRDVSSFGEGSDDSSDSNGSDEGTSTSDDGVSNMVEENNDGGIDLTAQEMKYKSLNTPLSAETREKILEEGKEIEEDNKIGIGGNVEEAPTQTPVEKDDEEEEELITNLGPGGDVGDVITHTPVEKDDEEEEDNNDDDDDEE